MASTVIFEGFIFEALLSGKLFRLSRVMADCDDILTAMADTSLMRYAAIYIALAILPPRQKQKAWLRRADDRPLIDAALDISRPERQYVAATHGFIIDGLLSIGRLI